MRGEVQVSHRSVNRDRRLPYTPESILLYPDKDVTYAVYTGLTKAE